MILLSITLLALTTTPPWTYAGFTADPEPFPPAPPALELAAPSDLVSPPSPPPEPKLPPVAAVVPPVLPAAMVPPSSPVRYRLADLSGQLWEHADPIALQTFIQNRNQQIVGFGRFVVPYVVPTWR